MSLQRSRAADALRRCLAPPLLPPLDCDGGRPPRARLVGGVDMFVPQVTYECDACGARARRAGDGWQYVCLRPH